jgi:hypothetical protein
MNNPATFLNIFKYMFDTNDSSYIFKKLTCGTLIKGSIIFRDTLKSIIRIRNILMIVDAVLFHHLLDQGAGLRARVNCPPRFPRGKNPEIGNFSIFRILTPNSKVLY